MKMTEAKYGFVVHQNSTGSMMRSTKKQLQAKDL